VTITQPNHGFPIITFAHCYLACITYTEETGHFLYVVYRGMEHRAPMKLSLDDETCVNQSADSTD